MSLMQRRLYQLYRMMLCNNSNDAKNKTRKQGIICPETRNPARHMHC
jgi:hypothetical protein